MGASQELSSTVELGQDGYPLEQCEISVMVPRGTKGLDGLKAVFKPYEYDPYKQDDPPLLPLAKGHTIRDNIIQSFDASFSEAERERLYLKLNECVKGLQAGEFSFTKRRIAQAMLRLAKQYEHQF